MRVFGIIGIASILNLVFKIKFIPLMSKSLAPVGCTFTLISIVTGSLWGKPTWGTWWAWDARLTSMVILLLFYFGYIFVWKFVSSFNKANKISSIIAIIGLLNLPVIKYSVDWWNTLHQPSSITLTSAPTIHYSMLIPLIIMLAGMIIYLLIIFLMKYKTETIKFKMNKIKIKLQKIARLNKKKLLKMTVIDWLMKSKWDLFLNFNIIKQWYN